MKTLLFTLLISAACYSQTWETTYFFQYSQDMKMAVKGPYEGENDIGTTYNAEYSLGWEKTKGNNGFRVAHRVEIHPAIDYTKATWLELAYMRKIWVFNCYAGVEIQTIYRKNPEYNFRDPNNYTKYLNTPIQAGVNAELQYMIPGTNFGATANLNVFQAEDIGKKTRWDGMIGIIFKAG